MGRELQTMNQRNKLALWAERISACRDSGQGVKAWCQEHGVCEATFYKWQKKLFEMARAQSGFAEVTPLVQPSADVAVTVRIAGGRGRYSQWCRCGNCWHGAAAAEVMLSDFTGADKVYIACGYTDLRRGIDGLASMVQEAFDLDPFSNT